MAGVREVHLSVPLEAVHLRVPLHPVERDSLSCPSKTLVIILLLTNPNFLSSIYFTVFTFNSRDKVGSVLSYVGGQDGKETLQPLVFQKSLEDHQSRHIDVNITTYFW